MPDYKLDEEWKLLSMWERKKFETYRQELFDEMCRLRKELDLYDKELHEINVILGVE